MNDPIEARERIKGLFNITMTPFDKDGALNLSGLQQNVARALHFGYDGLLIGGTYGEFATMSPEERLRLFKAAVDVVGDRAPVLLCTAHSDQRVIEELTAAAGGLGGVPMVMPPYVSEITQAQIVDFFRWIAPRSKTGVMIYNAPGTGVTMSPESIEEVSDIPGIVALKQGDLSPSVVDRLAATVVGKIRVLAASDLALPAPVAMGFDGLSSTNSGALPELILACYQALKNGETARAARLHRSWYALRAKARAFGQPQTTKSAMRLRGWESAGYVRRPLQDPSGDQERQILEALLQAEAASGLDLGLPRG
ncbi:4-hydroxy-tetrahydrodipicolinate synthase [Pigmentiphaga soli]|uniref:4-hydroxy-tetrahydrodipicolinate synthase n=2 Tax=Pigmentiphaga soli TaxID=1007095 RepID=A0ABP8GF92_9BURK